MLYKKTQMKQQTKRHILGFKNQHWFAKIKIYKTKSFKLSSAWSVVKTTLYLFGPKYTYQMHVVLNL